MSIIVGDGNGANISCPAVNQFYVLGKGHDVLSDEGDDDIFVTGSGDDSFSIGPGRSIFLFEKGWGKATIDKDCSNAEVPEKVEYLRAPHQTGYGGLGLIFNGTGFNGLNVSGVLAGSSADIAGIKKGDFLLAVGGVPIPQMHNLVERLRGQPGSSVEITYRHASEPPKTLTLVRQMVRPSDLDGVAPLEFVQYHWPYVFTNFIIFGDGIKSSDVQWNDNHTKLIEKISGDEISFAKSPCFNIVFGADH